MKIRIIVTAVIVCLGISVAFSEHTVAHTHIGVNPTWRPDWTDPGNPAKATDTDLTDDNQLWMFSVPPVHPVAATPGWPDWSMENGDIFLLLVPYLDGGSVVNKPGDAGKQLWICDFLYSKSGGYGDVSGYEHVDGWHSAHGPQGKWNLDAGVDENTDPIWDIGVKRIGSSVAEDDFFMLLPSDAGALTSDGDQYLLEKEWMADKNAWGLHEHMRFAFWLTPDMGQEVSATFTAYDALGVYEESDEFEFRFVTVPEPGSMILLGFGALGLLKRRK